MHHNSYTFIEMLVVCVIVLLLTALVAPRIGTGMKRMTVENALSNLRGAFNEAAMRSRATGRPLALVMDLDRNQMLVQSLSNALDHEWRAPVQPSRVGEGMGILMGSGSYEIPKSIVWTQLPEGDDGGTGQFIYRFYPEGEASGPALRFEIQERPFVLIIDSVLGKATILEEDSP